MQNHDVPITNEVLTFLEQSGMAKTRFGDLAVGDYSLVDDLLAGREPRSATVRRIRAKIEELSAGITAQAGDAA